jgi:Fasciclin domain
MKLIAAILPLAAITSAFIIPDEQITNQIILESQQEPSLLEKLQGNVEEAWAGVEETFKDAVAFSENALDNAFNAATEARGKAQGSFECMHSMWKFDMGGWLSTAQEAPDGIDMFEEPKHPHHPPPHGRHPPHHGHHGHHKSNKTIYQLISSSKYTTKLAKLIDEYPDLVETLNGTAANYTLFAPTDKAFEKIPKGHKKPSKELIKKVLAYHVSPDFYPAGRVLSSHTIPTALGEDSLGGEPQRLRVAFSLLKGLNINFYSKIVAVNIVCPSVPHPNPSLTSPSSAATA